MVQAPSTLYTAQTDHWYKAPCIKKSAHQYFSISKHLNHLKNVQNRFIISKLRWEHLLLFTMPEPITGSSPLSRKKCPPILLNIKIKSKFKIALLRLFYGASTLCA